MGLPKMKVFVLLIIWNFKPLEKRGKYRKRGIATVGIKTTENPSQRGMVFIFPWNHIRDRNIGPQNREGGEIDSWKIKNRGKKPCCKSSR